VKNHNKAQFFPEKTVLSPYRRESQNAKQRKTNELQKLQGTNTYNIPEITFLDILDLEVLWFYLNDDQLRRAMKLDQI
jgi:hypothetical protein